MAEKEGSEKKVPEDGGTRKRKRRSGLKRPFGGMNTRMRRKSQREEI